MTTITVVVVCLVSLAACATLVFVVETLVAFVLHRKMPDEHKVVTTSRPFVVPREEVAAEDDQDTKAA